MKNIRALCFIFFLTVIPIQIFCFDKVIIWGHKLHSHTHSYIHDAFYKAFNHLGYDTYWFDDMDDVCNFDFTNSLFLTEGQVDSNIPLCQDCCYLLHNCCGEKYIHTIPARNRLTIQVYTHDVLHVPTAVKLAPFTYFDLIGQCVYMPWATDLLPHEIEELQKKECPHLPEKNIYWIGTIGGGTFGNIEEISPFQQACEDNGVSFIHAKARLDPNESIELIRNSYMAPTIVGTWQSEKGYIPCRIFKNISYGKMGITNSQAVFELFEEKIVYNPDTYQLFIDAQNCLNSSSQDQINDLVNFVKEKHTYLNRVQLLLSLLRMIQNNENIKRIPL